MLFFIYLFDKGMLLSDLIHGATFCEAIKFFLFKSSFNCIDCQEAGQVMDL